MMAQFLEDFASTTGIGVGDTADSTPDAIQTSKASYDQGYKAGWSDAVSETSDSKTQTIERLSQAFQETSFTYFEARNHILNSLRPVLEEFVSKVMPEMAVASLAPQIAEKVDQICSEVDSPIKVFCAPSALLALEKLDTDLKSLPVTFEAEPSLSEMQVLFTYADGSAEINLSETTAKITESVREFFEAIDTREVKNA